MVVPVVVRLLVAWVLGILLADALTALADAPLVASLTFDLHSLELLFVGAAFGGLLFCRHMARRRMASPQFMVRVRAPRWKGAAVLLVVLSVAFLKARCDLSETAVGAFHSPAIDRTTSALLPARTIAGFRAWCLAAIDGHHPAADVRGFVSGCLLGDRSGASLRMIRDFNYAGMGHLLAVSGLHLGFLTALITLLLAPLRLLQAQRLTRLCILALVWLYVLLIGSPPSAVRVAIMLSLFILSWVLRQSVRPWHNWGMAALLILIVDTRLLYNVSFQLSFTAAATILFITPRLPDFHQLKLEADERARLASLGALAASDGGGALRRLRRRLLLQHYLRRMGRRVRMAVHYTLLLQLAMMPLTLHYFHHVTIMGVAQSLLVLPLLGVHLSLVVVCLLCHAVAQGLPVVAPLFHTLADLCWWPVDVGARWMLGVASWCRQADVQLFGDVSWDVSLAATLACYALFVSLYMAHRQHTLPWWIASALLAGALIVGC